MELINQTKIWEKSIEICNKMLEIFQAKLYNYDEAACVLAWKSRFFNNMYQDCRMFPNYYKINLVNTEFSQKNNVIYNKSKNKKKQQQYAE